MKKNVSLSPIYTTSNTDRGKLFVEDFLSRLIQFNSIKPDYKYSHLSQNGEGSFYRLKDGGGRKSEGMIANVSRMCGMFKLYKKI